MFAGRYFGNWYFGGRYFGKAGLTVPGYYFGGRYFGGLYFGPRYFGQAGDSSPHTVTVTSALASAGVGLFGTVTISSSTLHTVSISQGIQASGASGLSVSSIGYELGDVFELNSPLSLAASGSAGLAVLLEFGYAPDGGRLFGGSYFGARYFGTRYFGTDSLYEVTMTAALSAAATTTIGASLGQSLTLVPTGSLAAVAAASFSVTLNLGGFSVQIAQGLSAAGSASLTASLSQTASYDSPRKLSARQGGRSLKSAQGARSIKVRK